MAIRTMALEDRLVEVGMIEGLVIFAILMSAVCSIGHIFGPYKTYTPSVYKISHHVGEPNPFLLYNTKGNGIPQSPDLRLAHWTQRERNEHLDKLRAEEHYRAHMKSVQLQKRMWMDAQQRQIDAYWARKRENWVNGEPNKEVPPVRTPRGVDEMRRLSQRYKNPPPNRYHNSNHLYDTYPSRYR